jgi:hypothetical protein
LFQERTLSVSDQVRPGRESNRYSGTPSAKMVTFLSGLSQDEHTSSLRIWKTVVLDDIANDNK